MHRVPSTDGVELAVHELERGDPGGPTLLWCHATGFHGRVWEAAARELPGCRSLAVDFRGYGDSTEQTSGRLDWNGFADDVLAVVDHFGLDHVRAVGHSKGGAAMLLAEQARPGTFARLVCFEPIVFPPRPDGVAPGPNHLAEVTRHRRERFASEADAVERFASKPPLMSLRADVLESYVRHGFAPQSDGTILLKARRDHEAQTYETGSSHHGFDRLDQVACPVLVCHGGDEGGPAQIAPLIADALAKGTLRAFPELGHFGPLEDPIAFSAVVHAFLVATD